MSYNPLFSQRKSQPLAFVLSVEAQTLVNALERFGSADLTDAYLQKTFNKTIVFEKQRLTVDEVVIEGKDFLEYVESNYDLLCQRFAWTLAKTIHEQWVKQEHGKSRSMKTSPYDAKNALVILRSEINGSLSLQASLTYINLYLDKAVSVR